MSQPRDESSAEEVVAVYETPLGRALCGDSAKLLDAMEACSADLVITSPPFALLRKKEYGNEDQSEYVDWLCRFGSKVHRVLKDTGSFVLDLGGAYRRGRPVRSLYNYRVLIRLCDECGFRLAEEFFWHNPSKLPSPIEWVNKRKIRAKDSVNTVWWMSKTDSPKADIRAVLVPYSDRMKKLLKDPDTFYRPKMRPSGHSIAGKFGRDKGGAIPPNLLQISNSESNSLYLRRCKALKVKAHPARFPVALPEFFIRMLTEPGDRVIDIFAGSNTTGEAAERLGRRWLSCDLKREYVAASVFRFLEDSGDDVVRNTYERLKCLHQETLSIRGAHPLFADA